jgi:hypothetical protein
MALERTLYILLLLIGTVPSYAAMCENNSVNYTGEYLVDHRAVLEFEYGTSNVSATTGLEATFVISPGPVDYSYVMRKHQGVNDTEENSDSNAADASIRQLGDLIPEVDRICVAPPHQGAGLECVDMEDAGITRMMPMEVDADCNLIKGWATYLEPKTPGCNGTICTPVAYYATYTQSDTGAGAPVQLSSGDPRGFGMKRSLLYVLVSSFALVGGV